MSQTWLSNSWDVTHTTQTLHTANTSIFIASSALKLTADWSPSSSMLCAAESHRRITKPGLPVVCCLLNVKCYDLACWAIKQGISLECCHVVENSSHCHRLLTTTHVNNQLVCFSLFGGITHLCQTAREQMCVSVNTCALRCVCVCVFQFVTCCLVLYFLFHEFTAKRFQSGTKALVTLFHTIFLILNRKQ